MGGHRLVLGGLGLCLVAAIPFASDGPYGQVRRGQTAAGDDAAEELLRMHHRHRVAHVLGDADLLASTFDDTLVEVGDGQVSRRSRAEAHRRFEAYFASVRVLEWEDVVPPQIRISPDGHWGEVIVRKRVRTIPADTAASRPAGATEYAWVEHWRRRDSTWRLTRIASTERRPSGRDRGTLAQQMRAYQILRRSREAVGGTAAVARIATLRFDAECEGPGGRYRTEIRSARDGRFSFVQVFPNRPTFGAGLSLEGGWQRRGDGTVVDSVRAVLRSVAHAHEYHLLALAPESRYRAPAARSKERLAGKEMDVVRFRDSLGAPVDFLYSVETGRPVAYRPVNHTGRGSSEILTRFREWRAVGPVRLPHSLVTRQGREVYRCRVTGASVEWLEDEAFGPREG